MRRRIATGAPRKRVAGESILAPRPETEEAFLAPGYAWVRVDDDIAYFYEGAFVGADIGFFVESASGGVTVDAGLNDLGEWQRTG